MPTREVVLANEAANVDLLSHRRLILGLGIATRTPTVEREFAACGVPFGRRLGMFEEGVEIMRRLWTDAQVTCRAGTAQACGAWLQDLLAAGAQTIVIRFGGPDQCGRLERCAKEVLPQMR